MVHVREARYTSAQPACVVFFTEPTTSAVIWSKVRRLVDKSSQDRLELAHQVCRKADQHAIPILQLGIYQCDHQHLVWPVATYGCES